jgi:hypothetical protein
MGFTYTFVIRSIPGIAGRFNWQNVQVESPAGMPSLR